MGDENLSFSIDVKIDVTKIVDGEITIEQVMTEINNFIYDIECLRKKYSDWLDLLSLPANWDEQLKNLKTGENEI